MGKIDSITRKYLSKPDRFAQICNHALFGGRELIRPELLCELDASELQLIDQRMIGQPGYLTPGKKNSKTKIEDRRRDLIKQYNGQTFILIIGLESQADIHYGMPLRHMLYDALRYNQQYEQHISKHRNEGDLHSSGEFLTGMSKSERLYPVITLCIYWGTKPWDGPKNLHEILDISPEIEQYKDRIGNYPLNLLEVRKIEDLDQYQGELKALLGFVKYQGNKHALGQFVDENTELFQSMSAETIYAMSVLGNSRELQARIAQVTNEDNNLEEVQVDMCQAIREMIEDGRIEGLQEGLEKGRAEGREEGLKEGRAEGRVKAETLLNSLNLKLLEDGRMEDLRRSLSDRNFQQALCREYALY